MSPQPQLDLVSLAVAVAGTLIGQQFAPYVGAYVAIIFGWLTGVLIGLAFREPTSRLKAGTFVIVTFFLTIGTTWVAAVYLAAKVSVESTYLLFPVAVVIPAVGERWFGLAKRVAAAVLARFDRGQQP